MDDENYVYENTPAVAKVDSRYEHVSPTAAAKELLMRSSVQGRMKAAHENARSIEKGGDEDRRDRRKSTSSFQSRLERESLGAGDSVNVSEFVSASENVSASSRDVSPSKESVGANDMSYLSHFGSQEQVVAEGANEFDLSLLSLPGNDESGDEAQRMILHSSVLPEEYDLRSPGTNDTRGQNQAAQYAAGKTECLAGKTEYLADRLGNLQQTFPRLFDTPGTDRKGFSGGGASAIHDEQEQAEADMVNEQRPKSVEYSLATPADSPRDSRVGDSAYPSPDLRVDSRLLAESPARGTEGETKDEPRRVESSPGLFQGLIDGMKNAMGPDATSPDSRLSESDDDTSSAESHDLNDHHDLTESHDNEADSDSDESDSDESEGRQTQMAAGPRPAAVSGQPRGTKPPEIVTNIFTPRDSMSPAPADAPRRVEDMTFSTGRSVHVLGRTVPVVRVNSSEKQNPLRSSFEKILDSLVSSKPKADERSSDSGSSAKTRKASVGGGPSESEKKTIEEKRALEKSPPADTTTMKTLPTVAEARGVRTPEPRAAAGLSSSTSLSSLPGSVPVPTSVPDISISALKYPRPSVVPPAAPVAELSWFQKYILCCATSRSIYKVDSVNVAQPVSASSPPPESNYRSGGTSASGENSTDSEAD